MFEEEKIKVYAVTFKEVMKRLEEIKDVEVGDFKDAVIEAFDGYNYDGEEELTGHENWSIEDDGKYELTIKVDHEDAYEFTLYVNVSNSKATIDNVL